MMEYTINGKAYFQRALVLGQWRQLMDLLKGLSIPEDIDAVGMAYLFGDKLPLALAIVLNPEGVSLKEKDIPAIADDLEYSVYPEMAFQVIGDFFDCNPMRSILTRLNELMESIGRKMATTPSFNSPSSSPEGTSPEEMRSSGDTPLMSASPG